MSEDKKWSQKTGPQKLASVLDFVVRFSTPISMLVFIVLANVLYALAISTHCTCDCGVARRLAFLLADSTAKDRVCGICCILHHSGSDTRVCRAPLNSIGMERSLNTLVGSMAGGNSGSCLRQGICMDRRLQHRL